MKEKVSCGCLGERPMPARKIKCLTEKDLSEVRRLTQVLWDVARNEGKTSGKDYHDNEFWGNAASQARRDIHNFLAEKAECPRSRGGRV